MISKIWHTHVKWWWWVNKIIGTKHKIGSIYLLYCFQSIYFLELITSKLSTNSWKFPFLELYIFFFKYWDKMDKYWDILTITFFQNWQDVIKICNFRTKRLFSSSLACMSFLSYVFSVLCLSCFWRKKSFPFKNFKIADWNRTL